MSSPEDREKHRRRMKRKARERVRSNIAKELITNKKFRQQVVEDKRGNKHDLSEMSHADLVRLIQEDE